MYVVDATEWSIIPAENVIAAAGAHSEVLFYADTAADVHTLLQALEAGVHGVVLRTDSPVEVRTLTALRTPRHSCGGGMHRGWAAASEGVHVAACRCAGQWKPSPR